MRLEGEGGVQKDTGRGRLGTEQPSNLLKQDGTNIHGEKHISNLMEQRLPGHNQEFSFITVKLE